MKSPWNHHGFLPARISVLLPFQAMVTCEKSNGKIVGSFKKVPKDAWKPWFNMGHTPKSGICIYIYIIYIIYILFIYIVYIYIYLLYNIEWYDVNQPFLFGKKTIDWVHRGVCYKWTGRISGPAKPQRIHAIFVDCSFLEIVDPANFYLSLLGFTMGFVHFCLGDFMVFPAWDGSSSICHRKSYWKWW